MTLTDLCSELKNWFDTAKYFAVFTIEDGAINLEDLINRGLIVDGQYFRITGSVFNDGVYQYPTSDLVDEIFEGVIWVMAVPPAVITLQTDITEWEDKYGEIVSSPYTSESFGGYSYSKTSSTDGGNITWQSQFASRLNQWRKIRT